MGFNKGESIATGLVKPKSTALFFDKLWVPTVPKSIDYIPQESLFKNLPQELLLMYLNSDYWHGPYGSSRREMIFEAIFERLNATDKSKFVEMEFPDAIIFNSHRNSALLDIVDKCKREKNIDITPIFIEKKVFKKSAAEWVTKLSREFERTLLWSEWEGHKANYNRKINVLEVCIRNIPSIIEGQLHWQQVLEVRQDKESFDSIKRLKQWLNAEFATKSESEIIEGLEKDIEDYRFSIKKHGINTTIGSISTLLTSSASANTVLAGNAKEIVSTYLVVSSGLFTITVEKMAEYIEKKREPIAFLYNTDKIIESNDKVIINFPDGKTLSYWPNT